MTTISPKYRAALAGKALLLVALAATFALLAWGCWTKWHWHFLARWSGTLLCLIAAWGIARASLSGWLDALLGQAVTVSGARPLASRRSGYSLKTPDGRFVEYVLYNPWPELDPEQRYTVVFGRYSRVLVERPVADQPDQR